MLTNRARSLREELTNELADVCLFAMRDSGFDATGNDRLREAIAEAIDNELNLWRTK